MTKAISNMALKPVAGSLGEGFYKLSYNHNKFYINGRPVQRNEIVDFLNGLENYIVTEYIIAHSRIRNVSDFGLNTLRVMVIKDDQNKPIIANAFMRFGTKATGVVDNASAGGIFTIVDVEKGKYSNPKRVENYRLIDCDAHPDTQENLEGYLPNWDYIKESLITVSKYLSEITYMGFDIAITDCGFKIIEINSHQTIRRYQCYYPLLLNNKASTFFNRLLTAEGK